MEAISATSVIDVMKLQFEGEERETLIEPEYKKIDRHGRLYLGVDVAGQEVLVVLIRPKPEDKMKYLKVGRS